MSGAPYRFPPSQTEYLRALRKGAIRGCSISRRYPATVSLKDRMPPVYQQAVRGTCVAAAAVAMLEYYEDCKTRLSLQYLYEVTKELDREWTARNLKALAEGEAADAEFSAVFKTQVDQIRAVTNVNGVGSVPSRAFLKAFSDSLSANKDLKSGCLVRRCFEAIDKHGVCRYSIWPYANMQVTQMFGGVAATAAFPPGAHEDARKHRVLSELYLLRAPNNVDEMRGILAGANGRRPMPICAGLAIFEGCDDDGRFEFPKTEECDGALVSKSAFKGGHEVLLVGYEDDPAEKGGGRFIVRNSWGEEWGDGGYGTVSYAYVECFCNEAGTILQDMVDYEGDGYNGLRTVHAPEVRGMANVETRRTACGMLKLAAAFAAGAAAGAAIAWCAAKFF